MAWRRSQQNHLRRVLTGLLVLALLWPVLRDQDGLPLSTYPMYAGSRSETLSIVTVRGVAADGTAETLSMPEIAETRDPLIAQSFLNDAVAVGSTAEICVDIAARTDGDYRVIEVARERHDIVDYVRDRPSMLERTVLASCEVQP